MRLVYYGQRLDKVIDFLGPVFTRYGYPFSVKSDNGPQFVSHVFKDFLVEHRIEHHTSPPLWPQANGEVERQNRTKLSRLVLIREVIWR